MEQKDHQHATTKQQRHAPWHVPSTFLIRTAAFSPVFAESAARIPAGLPYRTLFLLLTATEDRLGAELWGTGPAGYRKMSHGQPIWEALTFSDERSKSQRKAAAVDPIS